MGLPGSRKSFKIGLVV